MAKEQSFDVVSQVDMQEVDNAVQQGSKELKQRYDLKDSGATIALDKAAATVTVAASTDFVAKQVIDILGSKLVRRGVDLKALDWGAPETASGGSVRQVARIVNGIEADLARRINKDIRDQKLKVKVQIEGDKLRVFSAKRDELQAVIAFLKGQDYDIPLQYTNYR
ncbi:MAG: YajQ family cyclic di-GMP-binding protein [Coriobacteriia bacterium]|jgi:uncharacterized protein YajQ (UPF0234 family)|nr:YajQ family cyclic di-GMP-binding protein [Coriobacteriia bacterium]